MDYDDLAPMFRSQMSFRVLLARSSAWHWRQDLAACACIAVAVAVLVGALVVGSSLQRSLAARLLLPLGDVRYGLSLASPIRSQRLAFYVAGVLELPAVAGTDASQQTAVHLWQVGKVAPPSWQLTGLRTDEAAVNAALARDLGLHVGDWVVLRVDVTPIQPEAALFASRKASETTRTLRVRVASIVKEPWGDFSLQQGQATQRNVFITEKTLPMSAGLANRVLSSVQMAEDVTRSMRLSDLGIDFDARGMIAHSHSVLFTPGQLTAFRQAATPRFISTYIAQEIRRGQEHVSYGIVASDQSISLPDDEVILNEWVAADLGAKVGDTVTLDALIARPDGSYGPEPVTLKVSHILPLGSGLFRPEVTPEVRGITSAKRMDEWKTPFPVDMSRVTSRDEAYWEAHRASPKAIVSATLLQGWWRKSGYLAGDAVTTIALSEPVRPTQLVRAIIADEPTWTPLDLQSQARAASNGSADFASLFGSMSALLIIAGVIVSGGVIRLAVQTRLPEIGLAGALGLSRGRWLAMMLLEQAMCAILGMVGGIALGLLYAAGLLRMFVRMAQSTWEIPPVSLSVSWPDLVIAGGGVALVTLLAGWLQTRRELHRPVRELLWEIRSDAMDAVRSARPRLNGIIAAICVVGALTGLIGGLLGKGDRVAMFLLVSSALLGAGIFGARLAISRIGLWAGTSLGTVRVVLRMMSADTRRSNLSLVTFAFAFLVVSGVALFRAAEPSPDVFDRHGPAGGYAIRVLSPVAYRQDLSTARARVEMGIPSLPEGVSIFSLRLSDAAEGGCLNLASPGEMQVIGVTPDFVRRDGFEVHATQSIANPWTLLERDDSDAIPVFGDEETMQWIAYRRLGEVFDMPVGGVPRRLRLAGMVRGGLFSGQLLMSEANFRKLLPRSDGFAMHLVECSPGQLPDALKALAPLAEYGMTVGQTATVIRSVASVQRLYMTMFLVLGGLGVLLGSIGGAAMLARDMLARQGELGLLSALGWSRGRVAMVVLLQHLLPMALGVAIGLISAIGGYMAMAMRPEPVAAVGIAAISLVAGAAAYAIVFVFASPRALGTTLRAANA